MTFKELCKDFQKRKPQGKPTAEIPFFNMKWENGNDSVNDLLRRGLCELGYSFINDFDGVVWFSYHGIWECCTHDIKNRGSEKWIHFYMCKFNEVI